MASRRPNTPPGRAHAIKRALKASLATLLSGLLALAPCATSAAQAATNSSSDEIVGNLAIVAYTEDVKITDGHSFLVFTSYKDGINLNFTDLYGYHEMNSDFKAAAEKDQSLLTWRAQFEEAAKQVGSTITLEEYEKTDQYERKEKYPELFQAIYDLGDKNFKSVEGDVKDGDDRYRQTSYSTTLNTGDYISIGLYNLSSSNKELVKNAIIHSTLKDKLFEIIDQHLTGGHTREEVVDYLASLLKLYLDGEISSDQLKAKLFDYLSGVLTGTGCDMVKLLIESYENRENLLDGDTAGGLYVNREIWRQKVYQTLSPNEIYSVDITQAQLDRMMAFYNSGKENHYSGMTHNCATVCTGAWNAAVGTDANGNKTNLYLSALDQSLKYLDRFFYTVRELKKNILKLDASGKASGKRYEWEVIRGVELPSSDPDSEPTPTPEPAPTPAAQTVSMLRLYNPYSGEHHYTASSTERDSLVKLGWKDEGVAWTAPKSSNTPVYRLYNKYTGDHHYTTDKTERDTCVKAGWTDEGIGWYSDDAKGVPLYRGYNRYVTIGTHHYTTDWNEMRTMVKAGWRSEGVAWYGVK